MRGDLELIGNETLLLLGMTAAQQREFLAQMDPVRKSRVRAAWLAALLGGLGAHHFYLGQPQRAWRYVLFCWSGIPTLVGLVGAAHDPTARRSAQRRAGTRHCQACEAKRCGVGVQELSPLHAPPEAERECCAR